MAYGDTWNQLTSFGEKDIRGYCSSDDGSIIFAIEDGPLLQGTIYKSIDQGANWTQVAIIDGEPSAPNQPICCSGTGQYVYAAGGNGQINVSDDYGVTWTAVYSSRVWAAIDCSSDGSKVYAAAFTEQLVSYSSNYGATWADYGNLPAAGFAALCCSANGQTIYVAEQTGDDIYKSTDAGANWSSPISVSAANAYVLDCSSDGQYVYYCTSNDAWASDDGGSTWTEVSEVSGFFNYDIACSASGQYAVVTGDSGSIYVTDDYGVTWSAVGPASNNWIYSAISADASLLLANLFASYSYISLNVIPIAVTIDSITPNVGSTAGGTPVTIVGTGFGGSTTAAIDGNALTDVTVVDSTTLIGITPAGTLGSKDVTVTNP